jgi:outer membrane protein OmpA-like peptidoglycan-associated protein
MTRSEVRTAEAWRGYDSAALIIALLGLLALLLLWWLGYGPTNAGCCAAPVTITSSASQSTAPAIVPAPVPAPTPPPVATAIPEPAKGAAAVVAAAPEPAKVEVPPAAPAPAAPGVDCGKLVDGVSVKFATGSAVLDPEARAALDRTLECLKEGRYEINGHTDSVGNSAANQRLSEARANAVVDYLRAKGVDAKRMIAVGFGDTRPIADNATAEGRARNRRITIVRVP